MRNYAVSSFQLEANKISNDIENKYQTVLVASSSIADSVKDKVDCWRRDTERHCEIEFPYYEEEKIYKSSVDDSYELNRFLDNISAYKSLCGKANVSYNKFWDKELEKFNSVKKTSTVSHEEFRDLQSSYRLIRKEWRKLLDTLRANWELEQIQKLREKFLKKLLRELDLISELMSCVDNLGLEPGVFFDLSSGSINLRNIASIKRWLEYLRNDRGVLAIIDLMGKINRIKHSEKIETVSHTVTQIMQVPNINSKEEIVGVRLGNDLEHALPSELALMRDPETSVLFDLKYIESGLMCFDLQGMDKVTESYETEIEQTVSEEDSKGPMVICVDTSGSMQGAPETIAKAVTMLMVLKAKQDNRACYLINFSTGVEILNLSGGFAMESLISFLQKSFHGGTDVAPAISAGLTAMATDEYKNADMLIISDFIMNGLPQDLLEKIASLREEGNKFNSLVIDSCFMEHRLKSIFDNEWVYDPRTSNIVELINFQTKCENTELIN